VIVIVPNVVAASRRSLIPPRYGQGVSDFDGLLAVSLPASRNNLFREAYKLAGRGRAGRTWFGTAVATQ
jgi:hypothetical protein